MATNSMVPYSNPAGNNQMTPGTGVAKPQAMTVPSAAPIGQPTNNIATNPLIPAGAGSSIGSLTSGQPAGTNVPVAGLPSSVNNPNVSTSTAPGTTGALSQQEVDIYGKGVGGDITNLLDSIGGTNSATLQEYNQSLAPQEATAQTNLDASLGAGGVSANSSVAALGNANLQAQNTAMVAGEDANLTQSGQNLEASILTGQQQNAAAEVSASPWTDLGDVLGAVGNLGAATVGAAGKAGGFDNLF
jgi:hypothetical protein